MPMARPPIFSNEKTLSLLIFRQAVSKKLFDKTQVTGQLIEVNRAGKFENFTISAVLADLPDNSHLQFEGIFPMRAIRMKSWMNTWDANWVNTYLVLHKSSDAEGLSSQLPAFVNKYLYPFIKDIPCYGQGQQVSDKNEF